MSVLIDLSGKTAVVAGGRRGLGFASAEALARAGAQVVILSRDLDGNLLAAQKIRNQGGLCDAMAVDLRNPTQIDEAFNQIVRTHKSIDVLVNCVGVDVTAPVLSCTEEDWARVLDTNLKGAFFCIKAAGRYMLQQNYGRIVSISSILSQVVKPNEALYGASKAGLVQMSRCIAADWGPHNITVNTVSPGSVPTELNKTYLSIPENRNRNLSKIPLGRLGKPEEIANLVLFLCSDMASYITGQNVFCDGGWTLGDVK